MRHVVMHLQGDPSTFTWEVAYELDVTDSVRDYARLIGAQLGIDPVLAIYVGTPVSSSRGLILGARLETVGRWYYTDDTYAVNLYKRPVDRSWNHPEPVSSVMGELDYQIAGHRPDLNNANVMAWSDAMRNNDHNRVRDFFHLTRPSDGPFRQTNGYKGEEYL